jgi:hypothetical protein
LPNIFACGVFPREIDDPDRPMLSHRICSVLQIQHAAYYYPSSNQKAFVEAAIPDVLSSSEFGRFRRAILGGGIAPPLLVELIGPDVRAKWYFVPIVYAIYRVVAMASLLFVRVTRDLPLEGLDREAATETMVASTA